jgi:hypothetical protein
MKKRGCGFSPVKGGGGGAAVDALEAADRN